MEDHCNPKKRSKLHFKKVCGQCGHEIRAHRSYDTRGKHFDNLESFLKVLDTFERLHDLEIRKSRLERISQFEPHPGSPNLELDAQKFADFPGP